MREEESTLTINKYGDKFWRNKKGKLHCIDGPAVEYWNGDKVWYQNGKRHRIDGPAAEHSNGKKLWYIRNKYFKTKDAFFEALTPEEKEVALFSEAFHNA